MRLVYLSLFWVLGIYLGSRYGLHHCTLAILLGVSALFTIMSHHRKTLFWSGLCLVLLFGGILRFQSVPAGDDLQSYRGFFALKGIVVVDPDVRDYATVLRLETKEIKVDGEWRDISGIVLINAPRLINLDEKRDFPYYRYGDLLLVKGTLESPEELEEFDFKAHLARQGVYSVIPSPKEIALMDARQKPGLMEGIYRFRTTMSQALDKVLPEPQCSLAKAMLLGQRGSLSPEIRNDFSQTGTSHLLAISGIHVSIVAGIALSAGVWLFGRQRPTYFLLALVVIWLYAVLTGMRPSAIRAAIMGSLWLYSDRIGRPHSAFTALMFAAAGMLAINPYLVSDVGFQLSFAAMAGLVFLTPIFQDWGRNFFGNGVGDLPAVARFVIGSCAVTLGAILATLPLIAHYFGLISLMSLPATFFTLPAVPGVIITAAVVGLAGIFAPTIAGILGWITWLFTTYILAVIDLFAAIPFASIDIEVGTSAVCTYYGMLVAVIWLPGNGRKMIGIIGSMRVHLSALHGLVSRIPARWIIGPLSIIAILIWVAALTLPDNRLHIFVFDIGQGDSILICEGNREILIDGGPSAIALSEQLGNRLPFWDRTIELVILTHPDSDHITGLVEVLQRYNVERVLTNGQGNDSDIYREWIKLIEKNEIEHTVARAGQQINMGEGALLTVLHPDKTVTEERTAELNNNSVVLRLTYGNFSFLLTGDIGVEVEDALLASNVKLRSTALKVAHHGSSTSTSTEFLAEVKPMFAAISVGENNRFGHPADEVVSQLNETIGEDQLFLTSEDGTIEFITDGETLWIGVKR